MIELDNRDNYGALFQRILDDATSTQHKVVSGANAEVIKMFWRIGGYLNDNNAYGTHFIDDLARDLRIAIPQAKWTNARNLRYMAKFARETNETILHTVYAKVIGETYYVVTIQRGKKKLQIKTKWKKPGASCQP